MMKQGVLRFAVAVVCVLELAACGVESVGSAATVAKLQADQAKQAKQQMEDFKQKLGEATQAADERARKADGEQ